jgi:hypothetical protein
MRESRWRIGPDIGWPAGGAAQNVPGSVRQDCPAAGASAIDGDAIRYVLDCHMFVATVRIDRFCRLILR